MFNNNPKEPEINRMNTQPMSSLIQPHSKPPEPTIPSSDQLKKLQEHYFNEIQRVWRNFHGDYARLYNKDRSILIYPDENEILDQFVEVLKTNRGPVFPKHRMEKANMTYGDFKRQQEIELGIGLYDDDTASQSKRPCNDNGWDEENTTPVLSTNTFNKDKRNWQGQRTPRSENWKGDRQRGGSRGRGSFRGRDDRPYVKKEPQYSRPKEPTATIDDGWGDEITTKETEKISNPTDEWKDETPALTQDTDDGWQIDTQVDTGSSQAEVKKVTSDLEWD